MNSTPSTSPLQSILLCLIALAINQQVFAEPAKEQDPVIGRWRWIGGQIVACSADNTFAATPSSRKGRWSSIPSDTLERKYTFIWDDGLFTDQVTMSRDHKALKGKNQDGLKISAAKVE
jgi:hypothetical protein